MTPFTSVHSPALPLLEDRVDTDILFPARFLLLMEKDGLGRYFCHDRRIAPDGTPIPANPIDDPRFHGARILLAGEDFGCGSSREQAVWALVGFGIRCVIAVSFGEIFAANCLRNGVLAITLPEADIAWLADAAGAIEVDLQDRSIRSSAGEIGFDIAESSRLRLLNGWDDIDTILAREGATVAAFETRQRHLQPWLYP